MRLFISIQVSPELHAHCHALQKEFPGMKPVEEFHLTLQFLGEGIAEERVPDIVDRLSMIRFTPFEITLGEVTPFGHPKLPRGIWIRCRGGAPLHQLADQVRSAMGNVGFLPDQAFAPHITLGRYKKGPPQVPRSLAGKEVSFTVEKFHLMQSHLSPEGPRYQAVADFSFTKQSKSMARAVKPSE